MIHDLSTQKGRNAYANSDAEKAKKVLLNKEEQKRLKLDVHGNPIISKKVRNEIYREALERSFTTTDEYGSDTSCGLCYLLSRIVWDKGLSQKIDPYEACTIDPSGLPEYDLFITDSNPFLDKKSGERVYGDERWAIRQLILMFCIEMTE